MQNQEIPYCLDTNILVYAFEPDESEKQECARSLIAAQKPWIISWQVVQEFCHVAIHKFKKPLDSAYLSELIEFLLAPHCQIYPSAPMWQNALRLRSETQYRLYDSLIIAAALQSKSNILYSEDLQHDRQIENLSIRNPFIS